jgi:hypothetical protein
MRLAIRLCLAAVMILGAIRLHGQETIYAARDSRETLRDSTAGVLFVVGPTPREALVIVPQSGRPTRDWLPLDLTVRRLVNVDLFTAGSRVGQARIGPIAASAPTDLCRTWPVAWLGQSPADVTVSRDWAVAFEPDRAAELPMDSIAGLAAADSARLAADVARVASALPGDTAAAFRGLPFVVTRAWRSRALGGEVFLAAVVVRTVNQEADPRQERILLVAERDTSVPWPRYVPGYWERIAGREAALEATDLVAMIRLGADRRPTLIVVRDSDRGLSYALIERIDGVWQRRWASPYCRC